MDANRIDTQALFNFRELSPKAQEHLSKVYGILALTLFSAAAGCIVGPAWLV